MRSQECCKYKASLDYMMRSCLSNTWEQALCHPLAREQGLLEGSLLEPINNLLFTYVNSFL